MTTSAVSTRSHRTSLFMMLGSTACFITNVLLIRALAGIENVSLWVVVSARFAVGLAIVCTLYRREFQPSHLVTNRKLIERGLLGGLCTLGFYYTVTQLGAGRATFINNTYVIWGGLFAVFALREHLRPALLTGAVATLLGLGLLTNPFAAGAHTGFADFIALLNALGSAWIVVTIRQLHAREHSSTIFAAQCVFGLLLCAGPAIADFAEITPTAWLILAIASISASAGQLLMTQAFRDLSVAEGSLLQMLVPLGIAVGGVVFFAEHFTVLELLGGGLILAGTVASSYPRPAART
ncbi:MAG: DMT family transporter [Opitutaceae bacterium]|nr:DMT family transporter [Opitutaceae bacterium]